MSVSITKTNDGNRKKSELDIEDSDDQKENGGPAQVDLVQLLHDDNTAMAELFFQYSQAEEDDEKREIFEKIKTGMEVHAQLVEEIYYPLVPDSADEEDHEEAQKLVFEAEAGNYVASLILEVLSGMKPSDDYFDGKISILCELTKLQVKREEKEMFDKLQSADFDFDKLGNEAAELKLEIQGEVEAANSKAKSKAKSASNRAKQTSKSGKAKSSSTKAKSKSASGKAKGGVSKKGASSKGSAKAKSAAKSKTSGKSKKATSTKASAKSKPAAKTKKAATTKGSAKSKAGTKSKAAGKATSKASKKSETKKKAGKSSK
jgi:hypothetical protein